MGRSFVINFAENIRVTTEEIHISDKRECIYFPNIFLCCYKPVAQGNQSTPCVKLVLTEFWWWLPTFYNWKTWKKEDISDVPWLTQGKVKEKQRTEDVLCCNKVFFSSEATQFLENAVFW